MLSGPSLQELVKDKTKLLIVSPMMRPGVRLFSALMEFTHYPPRTPKNELFNIVMVPWKSLHFYMMVMPREALPMAIKTAQSIGMDVTSDVAAMPSEGTWEFFPAQGDNVYSLSGAYQGDEEAEVDRLINLDQAKIHDDFLKSAVVKKAQPEGLDHFINISYPLSVYNPTLAILFGGKRRLAVHTVWMAYIVEEAFGVATADKKGNLLGIFVVPSRRHWGFGTKLLAAACEHCIQEGLVLRIDPLSKKMASLVAKLPSKLQSGVLLKEFTAKEDLGELDDLYLLRDIVAAALKDDQTKRTNHGN